MNIEMPGKIQPLRQLWKEAFGDSDSFLDAFFSTAFAPQRCRWAVEGEKLLGALYWFDVWVQGQKYAYLYAVATAADSRGKGVCHGLMGQTHSQLQALGYSGCILVPGSEALFRFYGGMGYSLCSTVTEAEYTSGTEPVAVKELSAVQYGALRRQLLPVGGVLQEEENLQFLQTQCRLYGAADFLLACSVEDGRLTAAEYLGDSGYCPGILRSLGCTEGTFRMPGEDRPFAMYLPFEKTGAKPSYFGLAFD